MGGSLTLRENVPYLQRWPSREGLVSMATCSHPQGRRARVWLPPGWGQQVAGSPSRPGRWQRGAALLGWMLRAPGPGMASAHPRAGGISGPRPTPALAGSFPPSLGIVFPGTSLGGLGHWLDCGGFGRLVSKVKTSNLLAGCAVSIYLRVKN